jgi:hypothetical protein
MVDPTDLENLEDDVMETLCLLEKYFPPSFFDIMIHLNCTLGRRVTFLWSSCIPMDVPF